MPARQWKLRFIMIKSRILPPRGLMTIGTSGPELPIMHIPFPVTAVTFPLRLPEFLPLFMTAGAAHGTAGVSAVQRKVCPVMVEDGLVQRNDIGITSDMIRVARLALFVADSGRPAVKTGPAADVGGDRLVAIEAQVALKGLVKRGVTGTAILFMFGMRRGQRTRHDQPAHIVLLQDPRHDNNPHGNHCDYHINDHFHRRIFRCGGIILKRECRGLNNQNGLPQIFAVYKFMK